MKQFSRGQKSKLADIGCGSTFAVQVEPAANGLALDIACFGLDAGGKLSDDRYMVFFNQTAAPDNAVVLEQGGTGALFRIDTGRLPAALERLVFAASIDDAGAGTMRQLGPSRCALGEAVFAFSGADFDSERAVIVAEIYRHAGEWRFGAVGQGFAGGLAALLAHFGGTEAAASAPAPAPVPAPAAPKLAKSKVTLTKAGQRHAISLSRDASAPRELVVTVSWQDNGDGRDDNDDLDLRAGLLLPDGRMKMITAPASPGHFDVDPFVVHQGDVRAASGKAPASETVLVNPAIARHLGGRVALVFSVYSAISNGAVSVASLKPKMRMAYGDQVVECAFDFASSKTAGAAGIYTYVLGSAVIDEESVELAPSGQTSGEQTPWLQWDKTGIKVTMDGPVVFKGRGAGLFNLFGKHKYS